MHLVARLATSFFSESFAASVSGEVRGVSEVGFGLADYMISLTNFRPGVGGGLIFSFLSGIPGLEMVTVASRMGLSGVPLAISDVVNPDQE